MSPPSRRIDCEFILGMASRKGRLLGAIFRSVGGGRKFSRFRSSRLTRLPLSVGVRRVAFLLGCFPLNQYKYYRRFWAKSQAFFQIIFKFFFQLFLKKSLTKSVRTLKLNIVKFKGVSSFLT